MYLDEFGLPIQANGDPMDQLQRTGMIGTARALRGENVLPRVNVDDGLKYFLQLHPGIYLRHANGDPRDVSADQLIPVLACYVARGDDESIDAATTMFFRMIQRLGFAQNTRDGLNGDYSKWKVPDFMFFRAMPLFCRVDKVFWIFAWFFDLYLILLAIGAVIYGRQNPDNVDDNNTVITLAVCRMIRPTIWSLIASWIYGRFRPWNYGCREINKSNGVGTIKIRAYHPVYGALRWYHRAESGGNPEVAEIWRPICEELFE